MHADLKLAAMFSDHMVLQRDKPVPVWDWADAGEEISVTFGNQSKTATGRWSICSPGSAGVLTGQPPARTA